MKILTEWFYWQGVDFCINTANLLGIGYDEFNFLLFVIGFPLVVFGLLVANIMMFLRRKTEW